MVIVEENPKVTHSPTHDHMYRVLDERQKSMEKTPLKYSYNLDALKTLRQQSASKSPVRGTVKSVEKLKRKHKQQAKPDQGLSELDA
jgi:hypothetical protein